MNRSVPAALLCTSLVVAGCLTKPAKVAQTSRADPEPTTYATYVARRTTELQRMGGPFKDASAARLKAEEQARSLFGEPAPEHSSGWTWGDQPDAAQEEVEEQLEKMARDALRR